MKKKILKKLIATLLVVFTLAFVVTAQTTPPVGKYYCYQGSNSLMIGSLWIMPKNEYKITADGVVGKFAYDAQTREINWKSGSYVEYNWRGWYAAAGVKDDVRGTEDQKRESILLRDKKKEGTPFDGGNGYGYVRCYLSED